MFLYDIIELEQDILTGINANGENVSNKDIFTKYANLKNKISEDDKIRLISTLHTCLDLSEKDFKLITDDIQDIKKRPIYNLEWLGMLLCLIFRNQLL